MEIDLYHTSPELIEKIDSVGTFDEFLCFSVTPYVMTCGPYVTYVITVDTDDFINAGSLFYHEAASKLKPIVSHLCKHYGLDEGTVEELISERLSGYDVVDGWDADDALNMQKCTAKAAKILGFRGALTTDEQGSMYMIDMLGRENELTLATPPVA